MIQIIVFGKEQIVIGLQNLVSFGVRYLHRVLGVLLLLRFDLPLSLHDGMNVLKADAHVFNYLTIGQLTKVATNEYRYIQKQERVTPADIS